MHDDLDVMPLASQTMSRLAWVHRTFSGLSVFEQLTALIGPSGICTCRVQPSGADNRGFTWADAYQSS